jgi:hypothetical protein
MNTTPGAGSDVPLLDEAGDVWPLEEWLSREEALEEALSEGDTWHVARQQRVRSRIREVLGSLLIVSRRAPRRTSFPA